VVTHISSHLFLWGYSINIAGALWYSIYIWGHIYNPFRSKWGYSISIIGAICYLKLLSTYIYIYVDIYIYTMWVKQCHKPPIWAFGLVWIPAFSTWWLRDAAFMALCNTQHSPTKRAPRQPSAQVPPSVAAPVPTAPLALPAPPAPLGPPGRWPPLRWPRRRWGRGCQGPGCGRSF
jgi:hypothetical protein